MTMLFMGGIRPLPPDNRPTGIFTTEIVMPAATPGLTENWCKKLPDRSESERLKSLST